MEGLQNLAVDLFYFLFFYAALKMSQISCLPQVLYLVIFTEEKKSFINVFLNHIMFFIRVKGILNFTGMRVD